jgi:hypothetical protein
MLKNSDLLSRKNKFAVVRKSKSVNVKKSNLSTRVKRSNLVATRKNNLVKRENRRIHFAQKKKIVFELNKVYNRLIFEEKNNRNSLFFIYYHLLFWKSKRDTIFSWSQKTKAIDITRFFSHASRFIRCMFKRFWSKQNFFFFFFENRKLRHCRSIFSRIHFWLDQRFEFLWFKSSIVSHFSFRLNTTKHFAHLVNSQHVKRKFDEKR